MYCSSEPVLNIMLHKNRGRAEIRWVRLIFQMSYWRLLHSVCACSGIRCFFLVRSMIKMVSFCGVLISLYLLCTRHCFAWRMSDRKDKKLLNRVSNVEEKPLLVLAGEIIVNRLRAAQPHTLKYGHSTGLKNNNT